MFFRSKTPPPAASPERRITCVHCRGTFTIGCKALSATCPHCYKRLPLGDLIYSGQHSGPAVQTAGIVFVDKKGTLEAPTVEGGEAVEVLGTLRGNVTTHGHVVIGKKATWTGDCVAPVLVVEPGATIAGYFAVGILDAPALADPSNATPGADAPHTREQHAPTPPTGGDPVQCPGDT